MLKGLTNQSISYLVCDHRPKLDSLTSFCFSRVGMGEGEFGIRLNLILPLSTYPFILKACPGWRARLESTFASSSVP